jgi:hypothetical protein
MSSRYYTPQNVVPFTRALASGVNINLTGILAGFEQVQAEIDSGADILLRGHLADGVTAGRGGTLVGYGSETVKSVLDKLTNPGALAAAGPLLGTESLALFDGAALTNLTLSRLVYKNADGLVATSRFLSPNSGSTGAVVIHDATGDPSKAYLQFVNNAASLQYAVMAGLSGGGLSITANAGEIGRFSSGRLMLGVTAPFDATVPATLNCYGVDSAAAFRVPGTTNSIMSFYNDSGASRVGSITTVGSATGFNTSSDPRLKEMVEDLPADEAIAIVAGLHPIKARMISDGGLQRPMWLSTEVQQVRPHAVHGDAGAVDKDGNIVAQGVDYSQAGDPVTIRVLQHLLAENAAIKARLEQIERRPVRKRAPAKKRSV